VKNSIRVLQIIYVADRAGAETWLVSALKHIDRNVVAMDFLTHAEKSGEYDPEINRFGARMFQSPGHRNLFRQLFRMWRINRLHGPFDIVHSHVDHYGGVVMLLARLIGVRGRIAHSHNDTSKVDRVARFPRQAYTRLMKYLVQRFSTAGLSTSAPAAQAMFGSEWEADSRWKVLPACVDLQPLHECVERSAVRDQLGIPAGTIVFGHVGRFVEQKNHEFLIRLADVLATRSALVRFLLVGGGYLQGRIESAIQERGLGDRFIILAPRDDIPRLMLGAMDFFLFPSHYEGLGLALVEAQAAGLRCFASTAIPPEAVAVPSLVEQLPLLAGPERWADAILRQIDAPCPITQQEALRAVERRFDIRQNAAQLVEFYRAAAS